MNESKEGFLIALGQGGDPFKSAGVGQVRLG
jgi:hypothetical protein